MTEPQPITEADLHAYVDGELDGTRQRAVEAWLISHPDEAERIAQWTSQMNKIRSAYADVLAENVPTSLTKAAQPIAKRTHWQTFGWLGAVAASFVIGLQISAFTNFAAHRDNTLNAGLTAHFLYTPEKLHPVEVSAEKLPHLQTWLTNRVGLPVNVPDLLASGLTLLGGRVVSANDKPAALLMYETQEGARYTILVTQTDRVRLKMPEFQRKLGINALSWTEDGRDFVVSGPADSAQLQKLKDQIIPTL